MVHCCIENVIDLIESMNPSLKKISMLQTQAVVMILQLYNILYLFLQCSYSHERNNRFYIFFSNKRAISTFQTNVFFKSHFVFSHQCPVLFLAIKVFHIWYTNIFQCRKDFALLFCDHKYYQFEIQDEQALAPTIHLWNPQLGLSFSYLL